MFVNFFSLKTYAQTSRLPLGVNLEYFRAIANNTTTRTNKDFIATNVDHFYNNKSPFYVLVPTSACVICFAFNCVA